MKATIEIECDDFTMMLQHLKIIRQELKKHQKDYPEDCIMDGSTLEFGDDNCYGEHIVIIT